MPLFTSDFVVNPNGFLPLRGDTLLVLPMTDPVLDLTDSYSHLDYRLKLIDVLKNYFEDCRTYP